MIKKISVNQLRLGMHVQGFVGSWMDHPFWQSTFTLRKEADLQRILANGVKALWIDTEKGMDTLGPAPDDPAPDDPAVSDDAAPVSTMPVALDDQPWPTDDAAVKRAADVIRRSIPKIAALFGEARLGHAVRAEDCEAMVDEISTSVLRDPGALISVARLKRRDTYTYMHSVAVCALMVALGRQLGLRGEALKTAGLAGMLHDIGKMAIPLEVLNKPGKLTSAEFDLMKSHPVRGQELLVQGSVAADVLDVCLHHHERIDGSGYPHGLAGDGISLLAKMGAICDVYDAITSVRPYKDGWDPGEALRRMAQWTGHFEPSIFQAFVKAVGIYPVGSLVRLRSGRLAVVTSQNAQALLAPKVKVFFSTKSDMRLDPCEVDLASKHCSDKLVSCESPDDWHFKDLDDLVYGPVALRRGRALEGEVPPASQHI